MKKFLSISVFVLIGVHSNAQNYQWAHNLGSDWGSFEGIVSSGLAVDNNGNTIIAGNFQGTVDFDPGNGTNNLTASPNGSSYFAKYDAAGNFLWAKHFTGSLDNQTYAMSIDANGNILLVGSFDDTCDFDPGAAQQNLVATPFLEQDIFIAKFDNNGNYLWANRIGSSGFDRARNIAVDATGNLFVTGFFKNTVDFDPGNGTANLTATNANTSDLFFAKYDANGNYVWAKQIPLNSNNAFADIAVSNGNTFLCGRFTGTVDFDPSGATAYLTGGGTANVFFARYDANGNYLWAKNIDNAEANATIVRGGKCIAVDNSQNIYLTGNFTTTADFDPSTGTANLSATNSSAIYFAKYDGSGNYLWAKKLDINGCASSCIALDNSNSILLTGNYLSLGDFDPSVGIATLNSTVVGGWNIFMARYDNNGNYLSAKSIGGYNQDFCSGMAPDSDNNLYITGDFSSDICDFDPDASVAVIAKTPSTFQNIFFAKYSPSPSSVYETAEYVFLKVYPNPSNGKFIIGSTINNTLHFQITDITGRAITQGVLSGLQNEIDLSALGNGIYFLQSNSGNLRLVKNN